VQIISLINEAASSALVVPVAASAIPSTRCASSTTDSMYCGNVRASAPNESSCIARTICRGRGRAHAQAPTNLTQEMVIALRDVAGLAWGGTEMISIENGDFMHFDCRLTDFGHAVHEAGRKHRRH
jgi:hypothetical protein